MSGQFFIAVTNPAIAFSFAATFGILSRRLPTQTHLFPLCIAFFYLGLGFLTHDFRVLTPIGGINYAGNAMILTAVALACASVVMRTRTPVPVAAFAAVGVITVAVFLYSSWLQPSLFGRIIAVSIGFTGFSGIALWRILASGVTTHADRMIATGVCVAIAVAIARPALLIQGSLDLNAAGDFRDSSYWATVRAFTPLISIAVSGLFLLGVVSDLMDRMRTENATDFLTGLSNRRGFEQAAIRMIDRAKAATLRPALLLADIDDFKKVNDAFGHDMGDRVIQTVAQVLRNHGGAETSGRIGGEEFALFYAGTSLGDLREKARAIQLALQRISPEGLPQDYPLTVSIGLHLRDGNETLRDMLSGADRALYRAKHEGKNRAVLNPARIGVVSAAPAPAEQSLSA